MNVMNNVVRSNNSKGMMNIMLTDTWSASNWTYQPLMVVWIILIVLIRKFFWIGYKEWIGTSHDTYCLKMRKLALLPWRWLAKQVNISLPLETLRELRREYHNGTGHDMNAHLNQKYHYTRGITELKKAHTLVQHSVAPNLDSTFRSQDHRVPTFKSMLYQYTPE